MSQISDCLDLLRQLVAIPSESQNEEAHARFLADYLKDELEMETQLQHVEGKSYNVTTPLSLHDALPIWMLASDKGKSPPQTDVGRASGYGESHRPLGNRSLPFGAAGRPAARTRSR